MLTNEQKLYNKLIARIDKAEEFFETATEEKAEKYYPQLLKLINEVSAMVAVLEEHLGREMTQEETTGGFEDE